MTTIATTTHCRRGHELSGDNLYVSPRGNRTCVPCRTIQRQARARRRRNSPHVETLTRVPNAPFRERFLELAAAGEITSNSLALALGWLPPEKSRQGFDGRGDTQRVKRALGLTEDYSGANKGAPTIRTTMRYETAVLFLGPLGLDPHEAGV